MKAHLLSRNVSDAFRDFVFVNPVRFFTDVNPDFFEGTVVADAVRALNAAP